MNPIKSVDGNAIPCPSTYNYDVQDISAPNSGRTEDTLMHKQKVGQCVKIGLKWQNITTATAQQILNAFDAEYFTVEYFDLKTNAFKSSVFYCGDRTSSMYNAVLGIWSSLALNIIERGGK